MNLNLARLFSSYRLLEQQLADERDQHQQAETQLRADLTEERNERRRLQDRLLSKHGALPVFEPAPGSDKPPVVHRPQGSKQQVVAAGIERAKTLYESIEREVGQFVAERKQANGQAAGSTGDE